MTRSCFAKTWHVAPLFMLLLIAGPHPAAAAENGETSPAAADKVARGKYLVTVADCNDSRTPLKNGPNGPEPDMRRMLSGPWLASFAGTNTAWSGPWNVSFTANLTPDKGTGLGKWMLRTFMDTIRTGRHMGRGRAILPGAIAYDRAP